VRHLDLTIHEVAALGGSVRLSCAGPDPGAAPGQFCLAWAEAPMQPFLRLPLFFIGGHEAGPAFCVPAGHPYARLAPGDRLSVLGPGGRGFRLPAHRNGHLLVIAGTVERLLPLIESALHRGLAVTALTPRGADLLPSDVELHRGPLSAEVAAWADVVALDVADPRARAEHIRSLAPPRGRDFVQALITPAMPCGTGACQACYVELTPAHVRKLACVDGPVFYF
jgi:hypothetical protein